MFSTIMAVVAQNLDDFALTDATMTAFFHHAFELLAQRLQFFRVNFYLFKRGARDRIGG